CARVRDRRCAQGIQSVEPMESGAPRPRRDDGDPDDHDPDVACAVAPARGTCLRAADGATLGQPARLVGEGNRREPMTTERPDIVVVMTDEERATPPYEPDTVRAWRSRTLGGRRWFDENGVSFLRHYTGS